MKTKLSLCWAVTTVALLTAGLGFASDQARPFTTVVVVDGSPPHNWSTLLDATKNVYHALEQDDRILVFLAKDRKAFLWISTVKDSSVGGYSDFCKLIDTMRHQGWPFQTNPISVLIGPVYKHILQRTGLNDRVMIILVSEGKFSYRQAEELGAFASHIWDNFQWPLLTIANVKSIPRNLLLAVNKGRIRWCELSQAIDTTFLAKCIKQARASVTNNDNEISSVKTTSESVAQDVGSELLSETLPAEPAVPMETNAPSPLEDEAGEIIPTQKVEEVMPPLPKDETDESAEKLEEFLDELPAPLAELKKQQVPAEQENDESSAPKRRWFSRIPLPAFVIGGILLIVSVISAFIFTAWRNAKAFQKRLLAPLADHKKPTKSKVLMVRANGAVHRIGNLQRLNAIHIGRGNDNTVTLNDKKVALRHVRIFRRGENLFLKNLAGTPVVIGGKELGQRKKCQLALPAIVEIADNIKIQLFWERAVNSITSKNGDPKNGISNK